MSRLATARDRLEKAVARLEAALDGLGDADGVGDAALKAELAAVKRDYAALARTAEEVDGRLQRTIGRLELVLEN
ncbi:hypothetical protein GCM10017083_53960 [Thalassobaculum fulvum]|uniref:DUF4164 family protein n=1 Tax=Thalassobaculum fulvum TaxID=1633335 RepID=A0A918XXB8_9PROT|nr:hypothetical protein [Thalassobaculum fulvum]GHD63530.1 hypothetical protein GCM10017083_53960 [Thalassobaculum fulvum]